MDVEFSILVVCLNPGVKLQKTLESILKQTYQNYEIVIKDGGSIDGSLDFVKDKLHDLEKSTKMQQPSLKLVEKKDVGIYDAMNQAVLASKGRYLYFLNCGDYFYDKDVLAKVHKLISKNASGKKRGIYYGNIFERMTGQVVSSNPRMDDFGCYRNVPCHQACFYDRVLLLLHPFDTEYRVRADYEQFLWCFFTKEIPGGVSFVYADILIADYEGGGFSQSRENRKISALEHREIVKKYMPASKVWKYRILMFCTFAPLRTWIAQNPVTSGVYNKLKKLYYGRDVK